MRNRLWDKTPRYLKRLIVEFDHFGNVILNGRVGECISSRVGRNAMMGEFWSSYIFMPVIDFIFGQDHCFMSIEKPSKDHK
jgi:hypothetical protein